MSTQLINHRLRWKEFRQLVPMVITLVAMVLLFLVLGVVSSVVGGLVFRPGYFTNSWLNGLGQLVLGLPGLFAVGVGCLLIGLEKEQKTIQWLANLPIAPQAIVKSKLLAGLLSLVLVWIVCGTVAWILIANGWGDVFNEKNTLHFSEMSRWVLHTVFLLFCSMAINWKFKSPFVSLIVLVPVALAPYALAWFVETITDRRWLMGNVIFDQVDSMFFMVNLTALAGMTLLSLWLVFRFGRQALTAEPTDAGWADRMSIWERYRSPEMSAGYRPQRTPAAAMIWQFATQNRNWLLFFAGLLLIAGVMNMISLFEYYHHWHQDTEGRVTRPNFDNAIYRATMGGQWSWMLMHLAVCWMGVTAFQGDSHLSRVRFLADRGVSPTKIWLTRHVVPLAIFAIYIALVLSISSLIYFALESFYFPVIAWMFVILFSYIACVYTFSQWVGQLVGHPVLAAIVAPVISLMYFAFGMYCIEEIRSPLWVIALLLMVPLFATWRFTPTWIDRRSSWKTWAAHCGLALSLFVIPFYFVFIRYVREPGFPFEIAESMHRKYTFTAADRFSQPSIQIGLMQLDKPEEDDSASRETPRTNQEIKFKLPGNIEELHRKRLSEIDVRLQQDLPRLDTGGEMTPKYLRGYIRRIRAIWEHVKPDSESIESYREAMRITSDLVLKARESHSLSNQELADRLEIFLLDELKKPDVHEILGDEIYERMVTRLADTENRTAARQRAIAFSYFISRNSWTGNFGQFTFDPYSHSARSALYYWLNGRRRLGTVTGDLWRLASDASSLNDAAFVQRLAETWGKTPESWTAKEVSSDASLFNRYGYSRWVSVPGLMWHGDWEREAVELAKQLSDSKPHVNDSEEQGKPRSTLQEIKP